MYTTEEIFLNFTSNQSSLEYSINQNDTKTAEYSNRFSLPLWETLLWNSLFLPMVVVATGGNLIVIWIVWSHKRMRTVTNIFLVNLAIADTMVSTLNVTFNFAYMLTGDWAFGKVYCKISQFVAVLSICASVFTLTAVATDRYIAIMYPLRPRMRLRKALTIVTFIWIFGMIAAAPNLVTFTILTQHFANGDIRIVCYSEWPDGPTNQSEMEYIYNVAFMAITYFVPVLLMSYTYTRIAIRLWGSESIGEVTQRQNENIKSKRRVVKMLIVVVLIFVICWLPFHVYFIVTSKWPEITDKPYIQNLYLGIYWLAMSNSMYNPIIYCWLNTRFRQGFKEFFSCCPCINVNPMGFTRREAVTSRYNSCSGSPEGHYRIIRNGKYKLEDMYSMSKIRK
ncbi:tachykinin-like peptides receptor 99D isoform X2 [Planococcus citri]|uniref:tachykinin-like peptides receptor 99D isoform X2 n=1 Tax=Planococcus citri TaxID=170843 RepID=UPI0031F73775